MSTPRSQRSNPLDSTSLHPPSTPPRTNVYQEALLATPAGHPTPTYAAFSPATLAPNATSAAKRTSTVLVHQKSPLLLATPPQITRALAYSHPFILLLNKLAGLLSWSTGDPWESFLVVVLFWVAVLYGDTVVRVAGPVVLVLILIGGMYARRFSPLSSSGGDGQGGSSGEQNKTKKPARYKNLPVDASPDKPATGSGETGNNTGSSTPRPGHQRSRSSVASIVPEATNTRHQKTLDEMVETLKEFTGRCSLLLEPLLELTDFLSTQRTPTSATTRPALTALFVRILLCTPFWFALTLPPLRLVTTRRVVLVLGTVVLTWHARVVRVARAILWRSATVRSALALVTGLPLWTSTQDATAAATPSVTPSSSNSTEASAGNGVATKNKEKPAKKQPKGRESELTSALRRARGGGRDGGVRFTFILYENQRRWLGLGWTNSLFAYERAAWTDEHNNGVPARDRFELPEVDGADDEGSSGKSTMRWRWVEGSRWRVDGVADEAVASGEGEGEWDYDGPGGRMGWVYYDNKWQNGRRGQDGWNRWTRRRKWYRDAELVEAEEEEEPDQRAQGGDVTQPPDSTSDVATIEENRSSQDHTPTPQRPSTPPSSISRNTDLRAGVEAVPEGGEDEYDSASVLSTSSRSSRLRVGSIRIRSGGASIGSGSGSGSLGTDSVRSQRSRRLSEPVDEEDAAALTTQLGLLPHGAGREGESWGVGDEVRMGLE